MRRRTIGSWATPRRWARSTSPVIVCSSRATPSTQSPARSWASEPCVMRHPSFSSPTRFSAGTSTSVKNTSAKSALPVMWVQRPDLDAGRVHVDDQHRDALVLRRARVGAHVEKHFCGDHRVRRPHLLAVHDEAVAVEHRAGLRARRGRSPRWARSCRCTRRCRRGSRRARALAAPALPNSSRLGATIA